MQGTTRMIAPSLLQAQMQRHEIVPACEKEERDPRVGSIMLWVRIKPLWPASEINNGYNSGGNYGSGRLPASQLLAGERAL